MISQVENNSQIVVDKRKTKTVQFTYNEYICVRLIKIIIALLRCPLGRRLTINRRRIIMHAVGQQEYNNALELNTVETYESACSRKQ